MRMDKTNSSDSISSTDSINKGSSSTTVLSIQCIKGSSRADEWTGSLLHTGDIVEAITIGNLSIRSPFKNGKTGLQKILHNSFRSKETSIKVVVRRGAGDEFAELQACIVPNEAAGKRQYMLRAIDDPNYAVGFVDRTESECFHLQASRIDMMVNEIARTPLQDGYVAYPWEQRMKDLLPVPFSSSFYSILLLPKASDDKLDNRYNDLEDTLARANAWLNASLSLGIPITFINIQTESLLTKISGETASSTVSAGSLSDLSNLANASLYGFEDYHGVDIGVVRAVRLWFAPTAGEIAIEIRIEENDTKLGFAISRTEEGFIYISTVIENDDRAPSTRSGLRNLFKEATRKSKLLVVSRISNEKVLPWMVSTTGAVRCFDTVSISQKLSLHRHARVPIMLHIFLWSRPSSSSSSSSNTSPRASSPRSTRSIAANIPSLQSHSLHATSSHDPPTSVSDQSNIIHNSGDVSAERRLERDTAGEYSFRFHEFSPPNNWV